MTRRKLTYVLRPALPRRAIVWLPRFPNAAPIDRFRSSHDPLGNTMPPHLTLIFPFHSRLTLDQLASHVQKVVRAWPCFPVEMSGPWSAQSEWVGLATRVGREALIEMHDRLYSGPLAEFLKTEFEYDPHITLGRARDAREFDDLSQRAMPVVRASYRDLLTALTIIRLDADSSPGWVREREIHLGW